MAPNTRKSAKKCADGLIKIKEFITPEDRKQAMSHLNISYVTISRYLQGKVPNLDMGVKLLEFFTQQLKDRQTAVDGLDDALQPLMNKRMLK